MTEVANFLFATEVQTCRPETCPAPTPARSSLTVSPYKRLKELKERAKLAEQSFRTQMMSHHRVQRSFEEVTRKSLLKRVEFLKIYGNKKAKYQGRELVDCSKREAEVLERKSMEMVKRRKLENELQLILVKNEEEDHALQIAMLARREKEVLPPPCSCCRNAGKSHSRGNRLRTATTTSRRATRSSSSARRTSKLPSPCAPARTT
jgi:hypothetical protein